MRANNQYLESRTSKMIDIENVGNALIDTQFSNRDDCISATYVEKIDINFIDWKFCRKNIIPTILEFYKLRIR